MSDEIDMRLIGAFTAVAAVQFGTTARDVYRAWMNRNRKPKPTDYDRVINNCAINGWSVAVPAMAGLNKETNEMIIYGPVDPVIVDPDGKENPPTATDSTITLMFWHPDLNGSKIYSIRQYSVFDGTEKILFSMRYEPWMMKPFYSVFLTPTTILTAMRLRPKPEEAGKRKFQVITFNTKKPTPRSFRVEAPGEWMSIMCAYVSNRPKYQLHIIYYHEMDVEGSGVEFFDCKCHDPFGNGAWTWESISFLLGNRSNHSWFNVGSTVLFVAIDDANPMDTDAHMCITFDQSSKWQMGTLTQWLESKRIDQASCPIHRCLVATHRI